ncbi:hypothetical protein [Roseateles chitinivorans]|uniref:hypothetical protein n=1 Tax=Roseateles chitinivorans TaxID=2917965 RepID=UPI003D66959F
MESQYISGINQPENFMLLDLNDASSIVEWWAIYPVRHGALLSDWAQRRPEHRASIQQAHRLIKADPSLRVLLSNAKRQQEDAVGHVILSHYELAAGVGERLEETHAG